MSAELGPHVRSEVAARVATVVISNSERRNALTGTMWAQLAEQMRRHDADPAVRAIVLRGEGDKAFAAGLDLSEVGDSLSDGGAGFAVLERQAAVALDATRAVGKPVIALIHGACIGGGLALAMCTDIRVASTAAFFGVPAAKLGVGYPSIDTAAITRAIGESRASLLMFTGRRFPADIALRDGLVTEVVEPSALDDTVEALAAEIAANAPLSIRAAKAAIADAYRVEARRSTQELIVACAASADLREGQRAGAERRVPEFSGE